MLIKVLSVKHNEPFVGENEYMVTVYDTDGTEMKTKNKELFCFRAWLCEEFPFEINENYRFEFQDVNGKSFDWIIHEKGKDDEGWYILIVTPKFASRFEEILPEPEEVINCDIYHVQHVFAPEMIDGYKKILSDSGGIWPSFHDATMEIVERSENFLWLRFREGFLVDRIIDLKLYELINEKYVGGNLESFKECVTGISIKKRKDVMEVLLCNDYTSFNLRLGFSLEDVTVENLKNNYETYFEDKNFVNHGYLYCKSVSVDIERNLEGTI